MYDLTQNESTGRDAMPEAMMPGNTIIVQCGECKTKFRFRLPEKASAEILLKCGACGAVFAFSPPERKLPPKMIDLSLLDINQQEKEPEAFPPPPPMDVLPARRPGLRRGLLYFLLTAVLLALAGFIWLNPSIVPIPALRDVPGLSAIMERLGLTDRVGRLVESRPDDGLDPVEKIQIGGLQQRFVTNAKLGRLRIIEGTVTNESAAPLTRVRMIGKLYDDRSTLLAVQTASCGRILPDEKLAEMTEQELLLARDGEGNTDQASGRDSERIPPGGQIPFMIVFAREPGGVSHAYVMAISAQKAAR